MWCGTCVPRRALTASAATACTCYASYVEVDPAAVDKRHRTNKDVSYESSWVQDMVRSFPDGQHVRITVEAVDD